MSGMPQYGEEEWIRSYFSRSNGYFPRSGYVVDIGAGRPEVGSKPLRLISFSLFGRGRHYREGAVENAELARQWYPGWRVRFYCGPEVPDVVLGRLERAGAELVRMGPAPGALAMSWRFLPAGDRKWDAACFRDADSRLGPREAAAVDEWLESGLPFHCMHDHEHHRSWPVFGGMWGCRWGSLPRIAEWIARWPHWAERLDDMRLLRDVAWPVMAGRTLRHSSVPVEWESRPFPPHEPWEGFVGEQVGGCSTA